MDRDCLSGTLLRNVDDMSELLYMAFEEIVVTKEGVADMREYHSFADLVPGSF